MPSTPKFYGDEKGDNLVEVLCSQPEKKIECTCCGKQLKELVPNNFEGASEKHLPVVEQNENEITVKVGSIYHPMTQAHSIAWVCLQTKRGIQRVWLNPAQEPVACFAVAPGDQAVAAYAYCNLHGFWKTEI